LNNDYYISLQSGKVAIVCGCECVIEYSDKKIVLRLSKGNLSFCGEKLTLSSYFGNEIKISGNITDMSLEKKIPC